MERKIKLSPAMRVKMWSRFRWEREYPTLTGPYVPAELRAAWRLPARMNTVDALVRRGLLARNVFHPLTDAGRAWIAEQIEAAHVEALWENLDRAQHRDPLGFGAECERAEWMLLRAGEQVGLMIPADLAERDHAEALAMNTEREPWHTHTAAHRMIEQDHAEALAMNTERAVA